jgi:hypothetical protein
LGRGHCDLLVWALHCVQRTANEKQHSVDLQIIGY